MSPTKLAVVLSPGIPERPFSASFTMCNENAQVWTSCAFLVRKYSGRTGYKSSSHTEAMLYVDVACTYVDVRVL